MDFGLHHPGATSSRRRQIIISLPPPTVDGEEWDVFWAQHYVGADLLREEIERAGVDTSDLGNLIGIWDSSERNHGEHVSNTIAGPHPSAIIPTDNYLQYRNLSAREDNDYVENYRQAHKQCLQNNICPPISTTP